jgi:hypothetical protein
VPVAIRWCPSRSSPCPWLSLLGVLGKIAVGLACVAVGVGLFALGRVSADEDGAREEGRAAGLREGRAAGLREGRAAGLSEGRALQTSESAPAGSRRAVRRAFAAGYTAGANDVFGGFDGGWSLSAPYVITLRPGSGAVTYRIDSRRPARGTSQP